MHVRTRPSCYPTAGGVCHRPHRRSGSDAQSAPSSIAITPATEISASTSRFVPDRGNSRRSRTIVRRARRRSGAPHGPGHDRVNGPVSPGSARLVRAVQWYQRAFDGRPSPCRFSPTCSCYAVEAFEVHGTGRGLWLTVRRLLRCRPFGPSGFDPVPLPQQKGA